MVSDISLSTKCKEPTQCHEATANKINIDEICARKNKLSTALHLNDNFPLGIKCTEADFRWKGRYAACLYEKNTNILSL